MLEYSLIFWIFWLFPTGSEASCGCGSSGQLSLLLHSQNVSRPALLNHLLEGYNSLLLPNGPAPHGPAPHDDDPLPSRTLPVNVVVDMYINSFNSISVDTMDYSLNIYMRQAWVDPRLSYDLHNYTTPEPLILDHRFVDAIWIPDLFFSNEKSADEHCVTVPNRLARVYANGTVWLSARYSLTFACHMNLRMFPFDRQMCKARLESYGHTEDDIQLSWRQVDDVQISEDLEMPQFKLYEINTGKCKISYITGKFSCIEVKFLLHREYGYYIIQTYIPSLLIVILSWVGFWINIDAIPARISLGVLTVLTLTTQCVGVWSALPRVSYVKSIDVWMSVCVLLVFSAMLEFAIVNTMARREIRQRQSNASDVKTSNGSSLKSSVTSTIHVSNRTRARMVDKVSRILFPAMFIFFNIAYWIICLVI